MRLAPGKREFLVRFLAGESGATAIEYTLIAGGIALAIIAAVNSIGGVLAPKYLAATGGLQ